MKIIFAKNNVQVKKKKKRNFAFKIFDTIHSLLCAERKYAFGKAAKCTENSLIAILFQNALQYYLAC